MSWIDDRKGNKIASVPVTLPVTDFLREIFCCLNAKLVFSLQKLTAKHKLEPAGHCLIGRIHLNTR